MAGQDFFSSLTKPTEGTSFPSPFISPSIKDEKEYNLQVAQAIYWNNWQSYSNPFGSFYRNQWIDNRYWSRGTQSQLPFAVRPPAKNDHTKNPLLAHIDFSPVNEMVKYSDIWCSMVEQNDFDIIATAINPAAAAARNDIYTQAEAYMRLKQTYDELDKIAGAQVSPSNPLPYEFDTKQELDMFMNLGFKAEEETQAEIVNEVVLNDSDWEGYLRKLIVEDFRDTGFGIVKVESDTLNRIRADYVDPINSGWEDFRGHFVKQPCRFWTMTVKTGAQIISESGGQLTREDVLLIARMYSGKFGNPMIPTNMTSSTTYGYVNTDSPANGFYYDSWKFPVIEAWWEDWDIYKYRSIARTSDGVQESFSPVDFEYRPKAEIYIDKRKDGTEVEKKVTVKESHMHVVRQCKWVVGTEACYQYGKTPNCPRNPYDIRFPLFPIKIYRATNAPITQRLKPLAKQAQNAWYKFQNEIAKAKPHGVKINVTALDNISTLDGKKIKRYHLLELYNEEGTILYADRGAMDDMGNTIRKDPIEPIANVDMAAFQRWIDVINFCSFRMQQESGLNQFTDASTPNANIPVASAKAAIKSTSNAMQQYVDGLSKISEEIAIDAIGKFQVLVRKGLAKGYISSVGGGLSKTVPINDNITNFTFGIKIQAKPTQQQREELKAEIRKAFAGIGTPTEGSPYLADLLSLEQEIDSGTNLKVCAIIANNLHQKNLRQQQLMQQENMKIQGQINDTNAQKAMQFKIQEAMEMSKITMNETKFATDEAIRLETAKSQLKTQNQLIANQDKSSHKTNELIVKTQLGA